MMNPIQGRRLGSAVAFAAFTALIMIGGCGDDGPTLVENTYTHHAVLQGTVVTTSGKPAIAVSLHVSYPAGVTGSGAAATTDTLGMYSMLVKRSDVASSSSVSAPLYIVLLTTAPAYTPPFIRDSVGITVSYGRITVDPPPKVVNLTAPLP